MFRNSSRTFRWTLTAAAALAIAGAVGFVSVYRSAERLLDAEVRAEVVDELQRLEEIHDVRGEDHLRRAVAERIALYRDRTQFYELDDSAGTLTSAQADPPIAGLAAGWHGLALATRPNAESRMVLARVAVLPDGTHLAVGRIRTDRALLHRVAGMTAAAAGGMLLVIGLAASWLVGRSVRLRLEGITRATGAIVDGRFRGRLPASRGHDEFDTLSDNINAMLDAIEKLVASQHAATTAIAHDLRTPVTRLRGRLETALRDGDADSLRDAIGKSIADADGIVAAFNALLRIAKLEAVAGQPAPCAIAPVIRDVCELYAPLADEAGLALSLDLMEGLHHALAEPALLSQAFANVLDNAVKYTPPGGRIAIRLKTDGAWTAITVADDGPGIPAADRARVLRPFVRLDASRSAPGSGLGLSVVAAIAEHMGGEFGLADAAPGLAATLKLRSA